MSTVCSRATRHAAPIAVCAYLPQSSFLSSYRLIATMLLLIASFFASAQGPLINSTPVTTATVGQTYTYGATAMEPSNKPVTMSVVTKPSWLTFSSSGQSTSTQFGSAIAQPGGVAGDAAGNIYVTNLSGTSPKVFKIAPDGTTSEWFTRKGGYVYAMLVHDNYLYLSYYSPVGHTDRITRVSLTDGTPVEVTIAGTGTFSGPLSMVHKDGFLYIADWNASRIRRLRLSDNSITDVLTLSNVFGLGFGPNGLLYAAAYSQFKIFTADLSNANPQSTLLEKVLLPSYTTDVKIDANGFVYVSGNGFVRKYAPDMNNFSTAWSGSGYVWGMSLTPGGALVFGLNSQSQVHRLQTGATLTGTPAIGDIGIHPVSIKADNGTESTLQNYDIAVYGPSTFSVIDLIKNQGDAPFALAQPNSNSPGAITYTSSNSAVAMVNGNTVTIIGVGTTSITVTQAASGLYLQTEQTFTLTVKPHVPVINSFTPANGTTGTAITINGAYFDGTSSVSIGGNPVNSYTVISSTQISAVVADGTPNGVISVTTPAGTAHSAETFSTVLPPVIHSFAPGSVKAGDHITLTGNNFNSATAVKINGMAAGSFTVMNTTSITAIIAAGNTTGRIEVITPFGTATTPNDLVVMQPPAIGNFAAINKVYGDAPFALVKPVTNSSGAFTFTSSNSAVATISGDVVTIVGAGTVTITATQAADPHYLEGSVSTTLVVEKATPVISGFNNLSKVYGSDVFQLTRPQSNSTGNFTYSSNNSLVASLNQNAVSITGAGTAVITAIQSETDNYKSGFVTAILEVEKAVPSISKFTAITKTYGDDPFTLVVPLSNSAGAFTFASNNTAVATVSGQLVTIRRAGTATITASQAETANYKSTSVTTTLTVTKATPSISGFASLSKSYEDAPFQLVPPASSSTAPFSFSSSNPAVATISGRTITITGAGTAVISATQAADDNYVSGAVTATLTVNKAVPVLSNFAVPEKIFGEAPFTLTAPLSASPGNFSYTSSHSGVAIVEGNLVIIKGAGTATITALQAETDNYEGAAVSVMLTISKATPVLSSFEAITKTYGDPAFVLQAPASTSPGNFTYTTGNAAVARAGDNTITITGAGSTTIMAVQAETDNYKGAAITAMLTVNKATPVLQSIEDIHKTYGDAPFSLVTPGSSSSGAFTYASSNTALASVSGNRISIRGAGVVTLTIIQAETANYRSASMTSNLTIDPKLLTVKANNQVRCTGYDNPSLSYAITGFVNGDNVSVLQAAPVVTTNAGRTSLAGNYSITASGAMAANYSFTYIDGNLQVADPQHAPQRLPVADVLQGESTPLQAREFGVAYLWSPAQGLSTTRTARTQVRLEQEMEYRVAITEASGCVVVDTLLVRVFERPDVFVPTLFSPNGDGVNDVLRLNAVALRNINYFRVYNQWGKLVFQTNSLVEGWDGRFQGQLQPMATYNWILTGVDKNGKIIRRSGSTTLAR